MPTFNSQHEFRSINTHRIGSTVGSTAQPQLRHAPHCVPLVPPTALAAGVSFFPDIEPDQAQVQVLARGDLSARERDLLVQQVGRQQVHRLGRVRGPRVEDGEGGAQEDVAQPRCNSRGEVLPKALL